MISLEVKKILFIFALVLCGVGAFVMLSDNTFWKNLDALITACSWGSAMKGPSGSSVPSFPFANCGLAKLRTWPELHGHELQWSDLSSWSSWPPPWPWPELHGQAGLADSSGRSSPELGFSAEPHPGAVQCSPHQGLGLLVTVDDAKQLLPAAFRHSFARNTDVFFLFQRERKDKNLIMTMIRFFKSSLLHSYCLPWNPVEDLHISVYVQRVDLLGRQCIYLIGQWRTGTERKHFFPAKVLVHVYSTSVFLFSKSHLPSECNQSPWGLRNKKVNPFHLLNGPWGWDWE